MLLNQCAITLALALAAPAVADTLSTQPDSSPTIAASAALDAGNADWQPVMENRYLVPYGYGFSPIYDFGARPLAVDALRTDIFVERGNFCGANLYSLDVTFSPEQTVLSRFYPDAQGVVSLPNAKVFKLSFVLNQPYLSGGKCIVRLSAKAGGDTDDPTGDYTLAGVLHYDGGFQDQLALATDGSDKIVRFWARVPTFCTNVEILEAGSVTEGHYDVAHVVDAAKHIYEINGGAGTRLSAVKLTLNGPRASSCDIPVYFQKSN